MLSTKRKFTEEKIQRLREILDQTCDDLGIPRDSSYAVRTRNNLKHQFHLTSKAASLKELLP